MFRNVIIFFLLLCFSMLITSTIYAQQQTVCVTSDFCCALKPDNTPDIDNCGYALLFSPTNGYLCNLPVPPICNVANSTCRHEDYQCRPVTGGAIKSIPPSAAPAPTSQPSCGNGFTLDECLQGAQKNRPDAIVQQIPIVAFVAVAIYLTLKRN